ncbi:hypothetical protein TREMEDRAFT_66272 [Tremella mesenterica DSM 1558]|uniref:uncharacterized protein n=1 Tax=Tremella mesenterica (strain ATCC 24925 / CBS 8224 / DSM 1558 / NBRC 9311 / NRRL Y-6157 / RJB 2259-6 / UBC 559-6) TaxID=578456 RepID=UPI00032CD36D|nr:uncharacterized protein TREMEDRAFT_66272 [Tremella mesenterica DSM 1558]EIW65678.1 hypothetical protein TREMEDRAFT_66272 [Tremella mesenterica DSM 1558]
MACLLYPSLPPPPPPPQSITAPDDLTHIRQHIRRLFEFTLRPTKKNPSAQLKPPSMTLLLQIISLSIQTTQYKVVPFSIGTVNVPPRAMHNCPRRIGTKNDMVMCLGIVDLTLFPLTRTDSLQFVVMTDFPDARRSLDIMGTYQLGVLGDWLGVEYGSKDWGQSLEFDIYPEPQGLLNSPGSGKNALDLLYTLLMQPPQTIFPFQIDIERERESAVSPTSTSTLKDDHTPSRRIRLELEQITTTQLDVWARERAQETERVIISVRERDRASDILGYMNII